ncbi:Calmodulin-regulated spectrin-associated protein 2 [Ilyodon furcidens]|uniref:Calmodulin-regulated spectrin-associated protein 2 n=1 Tax=Ilyodon furcidens TaxID=33524 RepID=A0ABV0VHX0_9TELE
MKLVPARYRKEQALTQPAPWIPPLDNLLKDSTDGSALGALLHFYCPQLLSLDDVRLKENMSLADRLYNLQLIQDFCKDNLNSCCHFSLEDMLYASSTIKSWMKEERSRIVPRFSESCCGKTSCKNRSVQTTNLENSIQTAL